MDFLVLGSYSILILTYSQLLSLATLLAITMDTLILGDSIIKYLQKDFVHKNVHVKAFPGYNISRLHARLDTDQSQNTTEYTYLPIYLPIKTFQSVQCSWSNQYTGSSWA